jgi:transcriptional regulator of acetoin/glycerol metabolism
MLQVSKARSVAWGVNPEKKQPELLRAWNQFIQTGKIETSVVPSHVAVSWVRSRYYQVNPYQILLSYYLHRDQYEQRLQDNKHLIHLAWVILENVFKSFGSARYVVALCDKGGYHLIRPAQGDRFFWCLGFLSQL